MQSFRYVSLLCFVGISILILGLFSPPTLSDDLLYHFSFLHLDDSQLYPIQRLFDLLPSQIAHYDTVNGRSVVHGLGQFFLCLTPSWLLPSVNALLSVLLVHLCVVFVDHHRGHFVFLGTLFFFFFFVLMRGFQNVFLWNLGTLNYLWVAVFTLLFILFLHRSESQQIPAWMVILSPLCLLLGWSHEGLSVPMSVGLVYYAFSRRSLLLRHRMLSFIAFYVLGMLVCILSPALWQRTMQESSLTLRAISVVQNLLFNVRIGWLLLVTILVLWHRRRSLLRSEWLKYSYLYVAMVAAYSLVMLSAVTFDRAIFFSEFLSLLLLVRLWMQCGLIRWAYTLQRVMLTIMALLLIPVFVICKEHSAQYDYIEKQMTQPGVTIIKVPQFSTDESSLMCLLRLRYTNPTVTFGFYSSYMAFDASDINVRCAARLHHKSILVLLPEDVVDSIEHDSTAYMQPTLDAHQQIYVWRLKSSKHVSKVIFELWPEDVSILTPWQRLVAYKENKYELDVPYFSILEIYNRRYLIFVKPLTNVYRRIRRITFSAP